MAGAIGAAAIGGPAATEGPAAATAGNLEIPAGGGRRPGLIPVGATGTLTTGADRANGTCV